MTRHPSPRRWEHLTSPELAELGRLDPIAILPTAAIEQHGPHLPLSTDVDISEGVLTAALGQLTADPPVLVLPVLAPGASPEHTAFPGTLSFDPATFEAAIAEIGASVARAGIRRLVVFNSHGGNRHAMDAAGLRLRNEHGMLVVKASYFRFDRPTGVGLPDSEWRHAFTGGQWRRP